MVSAKHGKQTLAQGIHAPISYEYADAAARAAATGFTAEDLYKLAFQIDNGVTYILSDPMGPTWVSMGSTGGVAGGDLSGSYPNPNVIDLTISGEQQGSILFFNGSNWVQLSPGDDGYVLTTHDVSNDPTWEPPGASAGGVAVSAGTQSTNAGTVVFSNSNGISFGMSNSSVITASVNQNINLYATGNTTQNSSTTLVGGSLTYNGLGGMSVGYSNGSIQLSAPPSSQITNAGMVSFSTNGNTITISANMNISAGTTSNYVTALTFSNSNGVSFGLNGSIITASVSVPSGSFNISAGTTSNNLTALTFSNSNGVSFGLNGSTITASVQTSSPIGSFYATGNTTQSSSTSLDIRSITYNGLGGMTVGYSNGSIQLSAPPSSQITNAGMVSFSTNGNTITISANMNISAGTTSNYVTALTFSNSNGLSFGLNGSTITASYSVPSTAGLISAINLSAGTTSNNLTALTFSNSNGLAFGLDGSTITGSYTVPTQSNQTEGNYAIGNTVGQSSSTTFDARTISISGAGNISVGYSASALIVSGSQSNQTVGLYATGNTTQNSSTTLDARSLTYNGLGGVSVGYSNSSVQISGPPSSQITGIGFVSLSSAGNTVSIMGSMNVSAGTTSNYVTALTFSNSNGVSFGINGSTITASYTVPSTAGLISAINVSAGTTSNNLSAITFSNANGVSFGLDGSTVTGSISQTNQTVGFYATGNTTQNSSTSLDARSLTYNGLGGMTVGYSNGSVQLSAPSQSSVDVAGIVTAYTAGNSITLSGAFFVSAGTTDNSNGVALNFSNSNNVSFGLSNGSVITASAANIKVSNLIWPPNPWATNFDILNNGFSLQHFNAPFNITATQANLLMSLSGNTNSSGALSVNIAMFSMYASTLSFMSFGTRIITWTSGSDTTNSTIYGGVSGARYRTISLNNWDIAAGDYMLGVWCRTTNNGTWRVYGQQGPSIVGAVDPNETNHFHNGVIGSTFTSGFLASINVTDTNYVRTGPNALQQPGIIYMGSF